MKTLKHLMLATALLFAGQAFAMNAEHPANPEAAASRYQPTDYFTGKSMQVAANEHQHETTDAKEPEGKGCKRGEGKGCCCCCKCCDKDAGKEGGSCMRKSGQEHQHDHEGHDQEQGGGKSGCDMMKKGMDGQQDDKAGAGDAHEGHH